MRLEDYKIQLISIQRDFWSLSLSPLLSIFGQSILSPVQIAVQKRLSTITDQVAYI